MYLIELDDDDLASIASDSEYFTASEDDYFSAEDDSVPFSHSYSSSVGMRFTLPSSRSSTSSDQKSSNSRGRKVAARSERRWTVDESEPRGKYRLKKHIYVEPALMRHYYLWRRLILSGSHPRDAATIIGSQFCYKQVKQKKSIQLFSIRLNHEHRVYFMIQEQERIVQILNIGGHSFG